MRVLATAGHVDHGKSSLVRALTGTDPDRFDEEKRRGLTIDLGFAHTVLPSGETASFVDVPGHVRFLRNMLAGVGGVAGCLFVVAATEGWKPQSEEHLRILELLGVRQGIVALTKVDLVDDDWRELAVLDVIDHVAGSFLEGAAIVPVSSTSGLGMPALIQALDGLVAACPSPDDAGRPRLWIDRVFSARGSGTVVTGTLAGGGWSVDDEVEVLPMGVSGRVRSIQAHGAPVDRIEPGSRVALNLSGVDHRQLARGDVVVRPDRWFVTDRFDARLDVLSALDHEVSRRGAYLAYLGSREVPVRVRVLGADALAPGASGHARVFMPVGLPLMPGDRFVLRESGRDETVGGGEVLDVDPILPASRAAPDRSLERVVRERGWVDAELLERLTGARVDPVVGRWVVSHDVVEREMGELRAHVAEAGAAGVDVARLDERRRALLEVLDDVVVVAGRARTADIADPFADHPLVAAVREGWFAPPDDADRGTRRELVRRGLLVERDGIVFHPDAVEAAAAVVARLLADSPGGFSVGRFRDELGITRKHAVPLLSELDARGVTRRRGDLRIAGPRLPAE